MNIKQAKEQIKQAVNAYRQKNELGEYVIPLDRQRPIFLMGAPGIGKTAIMEQIAPGARTETVLPHSGEEFGTVLQGTVTLVLGEKSYRVRKGDSFSFKAEEPHYLKNAGKVPATVLWVVTPPSF